MGSSVFVARETPLTAANLNKHLAGDGLPNTGNVALGGAAGLFWDDATQRLGRGTQAPASALDWLDASAAMQATFATNADADAIVWLTGDRDASGAGTRTAFVGLDYSANVLKLGVGSDFDAAGAYVALTSDGKVGINKTPASPLDLALATEDLEVVDAGSAAGTEQAWIAVKVNGVQGYLRVYAAQ